MDTTDSATRLLFFGDEALADGFGLIGFETYPDPSHDQVDKLVRGLVRERESALVVVDEAIMHADIPALAQVRREGGRIVVIAVPPLAASSPRLNSEVATRLDAMFSGVVNLGA